MKTTTFKYFLSNYVKDMSPEQSLSLFKNERYVQKDSRLLNVFSFYVFFNKGVVNTLLKKKDKLPNLYKMYNVYVNRYQEVTYENLSEKVEMLDEFDELSQLYTSYHNLHVKKDLVIKKMYHQRIIDFQHEKKISNYRIYTDLNINHGNTNDFLKNNNYDRLSMAKIKEVYNYVSSA